MQTDLKANRTRFILQGFFFTSAMAVAEPSTIFPLIVNYFSESKTLVGLFTALLKGGAVVMQLWAAYHIQNKTHVLSPMRRVFVARFLSWLGIGALIYFFSYNTTLLLLMFGIGLFVFSFSAGFGAVFFQEIVGKSFTREYRGRAMAQRQFWSGLAAIASGGLTGWLLARFDKPDSFALIFVVSAFIMSAGFIAFSFMKEPPKKSTSRPFHNFGQFLKEAGQFLKSDRQLRIQILAKLFSFTFLLAFPFVVIYVKENLVLEGIDVGIFVSMQMAGGMLSNLLWGRLSGRNRNKLIILFSYASMITALLLAVLVQKMEWFYLIFFLGGVAIDGFRLGFNQLILIVAPEAKRPSYIAIQNNITSLGLFFALPGGMIYDWLNFNLLVYITLGFLLAGAFISLGLKKYCHPTLSGFDHLQ